MAKCPHCPLADSHLDCPAITRPHPRYCQLVDPTHPHHDPHFVAAVRAGATAPGEPPGLLAMAGNLTKAVIGHAADGFRQAPPEVQAERKRICFACDDYHDHERDRCRFCGCIEMDLKRSWSSSSCPLTPPKWGPV